MTDIGEWIIILFLMLVGTVATFNLNLNIGGIRIKPSRLRNYSASDKGWRIFFGVLFYLAAGTLAFVVLRH